MGPLRTIHPSDQSSERIKVGFTTSHWIREGARAGIFSTTFTTPIHGIRHRGRGRPVGERQPSTKYLLGDRRFVRHALISRASQIGSQQAVLLKYFVVGPIFHRSVTALFHTFLQHRK